MNKQRVEAWLDYSLRILFLFLPFSMALDVGNLQVELPTEPLLLVTGSLGLYYLYRGQAWKMSFFKHPLFLASLAYVGWAGICTLTSNHFLVSTKYLLVSIAHWLVYFCLFSIFLKRSKNDQTSWLLYSISFCIILVYAWIQHNQYDFRVDASVLVARPFYFDHAMYGTVALLLLGFVFPNTMSLSQNNRIWVYRTVVILLLIGIYLSFSRAAWLSLMGALALTLITVYFRMRFRQFLVFIALSAFTLIIGLIIVLPKEGSQVLSKQGGSWQHLRSTINVSTDVSNLERLNRYSCAWRMFKTKPVVGFGPGNFIIDYYSFQKPEEMTRLSVTSHQMHHRPGKGGGSHSEYLQSLSEMGLLGLLFWLILIFTSIKTSIDIIRKTTNNYHRNIATGILFSLLTFYIHSLFNNFFHQEKVIALVWSALAVLVFIDNKTRSSNK